MHCIVSAMDVRILFQAYLSMSYIFERLSEECLHCDKINDKPTAVKFLLLDT